MANKRSKGRGRITGFTLIELLVVVSIIALLISILLPSLKRAREQAKLTACLANLKGIATASITYAADDENENAVPVHPTTFEKPTTNQTLRHARMCYGGKSGAGDPEGLQWYWGTAFWRGPASRPLNWMIYKDGFQEYQNAQVSDLVEKWNQDAKLDLGIYQCPSDDGNKEGSDWIGYAGRGMSAYDYFGTSYQTNCLWISTGPGTPLETLSPFLRPLSRIPTPSNTLYYEEKCGYYFKFAEPQPDNDCGGGEEGVKGDAWHKREWNYNVVFADAHAASIYSRGMNMPAQLPEYPGGDYYHWHCVIIRGDGWQSDVLPAPPVVTKLKSPS